MNVTSKWSRRLRKFTLTVFISSGKWQVRPLIRVSHGEPRAELERVLTTNQHKECCGLLRAQEVRITHF